MRKSTISFQPSHPHLKVHLSILSSRPSVPFAPNLTNKRYIYLTFLAIDHRRRPTLRFKCRIAKKNSTTHAFVFLLLSFMIDPSSFVSCLRRYSIASLVPSADSTLSRPRTRIPLCCYPEKNGAFSFAYLQVVRRSEIVQVWC